MRRRRRRPGGSSAPVVASGQARELSLVVTSLDNSAVEARAAAPCCRCARSPAEEGARGTKGSPDGATNRAELLCFWRECANAHAASPCTKKPPVCASEHRQPYLRCGVVRASAPKGRHLTTRVAQSGVYHLA